MLLLVLLRAFFVLFAIDDVGVTLIVSTIGNVEELSILFTNICAAFTTLSLDWLHEGEPVAALRRDPFEVRVSHIDWILLNRVNLVDQLISVVNLIS